MIERKTTGTAPGAWAALLFILLALVVGILIWQPWSVTTSRDQSTTNQSTTTTTQPTP